MSEDIRIPEGWKKSKPQPQEPNIEWVSIESLLDDYTIPVLAEAVEKLNVQTHNETGKRIPATNGDVSDFQSKAFVLSHLAHRYSMLKDPGPDDDLFYNRLEIEGSPLDLFGWPKDEAPDLNSINPHYSSKNNPSAITTSSDVWQTTAQTLAREYLGRHNTNGLHPNMKQLSEHVAAEMRKLKIYGPHKKPLEPGYIKRHALQGAFWKNRHTY